MAATLFLCYAQQDASFLESLEEHLSALSHSGMITTWHRNKVIAGSDWECEVNEHLNAASLVLLLVSRHLLASKYQYGVEFRHAMQQHEVGKTQVIPILVRSCDWQGTPLRKLQILPRNEKPLEEWRYRDEGFAEVVKEIRTVLESLQPPVLSLPGPARPLWNVPYRRNPYFTGRDEIFLQLDRYLASPASSAAARPQCVALTQPYALTGLGGIGKTQIAVEYAYRASEQGRYTHIFWINAASEEAILTSFTELAEILPAFPASGETDQRKLAQVVTRWLEQCEERWLLICDNADELALLDAYLPRQGAGDLLLTTRAAAVGSLAAAVEVETMGFLEGTQFLLRRAQRFEHASDDEINQAGNIVITLDHFPLALDQAGAYLEETKCSLTDYLQIYQTHRHALLARRGKQAANYPDSVATTWSLSFQKVQQANPAAAELLELCSFLAPDRIPEELLKNGAASWPAELQVACTDLFSFQQMIEELLKFSLVKHLEKEQALSIHRLVQAVQRDRVDKEMQRQWAERVVQALNAVFPGDPGDITARFQCLRYLDQAQVCYTWIKYYAFASLEAAGLLHRIGIYFNAHGFRTLAEPILQHALAIQEQTLETEHPDTAATSNSLAVLYLNQGKYEQAEPILQRALAIWEQQVGAEHPRTATILNNLADLYRLQGKYEQAESLYQRALAIQEQILGTEHPETATILNDLAGLYWRQGKYEQAESLYQRALAIREQRLGAEHPDTANSLKDLAGLYWKQGRYEQAEPLMQRALSIQEQTLGTKHPNIVTSLNNVALLYQSQGKYEQAEPLYQRALAIQERIETEHPNTALCLSNLADLYRLQGKYEQAEPLYQRALVIREQRLGAEHPSTMDGLIRLVVLYLEQDKYEQVELFCQRALAVSVHHPGPDHPKIHLIRKLYGMMRNHERAVQLEEGS